MPQSAALKFLALGSVGLLYAVSLPMPVAYFDEGGSACTAVRLGSPSGFHALLLGWLPPYTIPWSANVFLLAGTVAFLRRRYRAAVWPAIIACLVALTVWGYVLLGLIPRLLPGYYVWQGGMFVFAGCAIFASYRSISRRIASQAADESFMMESG